jgi:UDP-N-acetylmuramyl pentapeptide phosphotransferase/UDP-N-acetylglucosamine-1-phosphate transferase
MTAWLPGAITLAALAVAWLVHTRLRGFLPDDPPGALRKSHPRPTPMAGVIPALATIVVLLVADAPWLAGAVAIATTAGICDDAMKSQGGGLGWRTKAALLLVAAGLGTTAIATSHAIPLGASLAIGGFVFVTTNANNFLDNQNGVATALGATALFCSGGGDPTALPTILGAVWIAFLPFNWPSARMFLGDSGALPIGLCAGVFAVNRATDSGAVDWLAACAPVAVLLVDFVQVVAMRLALGHAPWVGDRRHVTHILLHRGLPKPALMPLLVAAAIGAYFAISAR